MSDDRLLQELARVAREDREAGDAELDDRWDDLAAGRLSPDEDQRLRALAQGSPEAAAAYEAFRPLDADFRARVVEAARFQLRASDRPAAVAATEERHEPGPAVIDARRRWPRWWLPAAALAAASVLLLLWPRQAPLPAYELEVHGYARALRSPGPEAAAERKVYVRGNRLRLVMTPSVAVEGAVAVRAFVSGSGGVEPLAAPPPAVSDAGAVRIEGEVGGDVRLPGGDVLLLVAVGRAGSLPGGDELRSRLGESDSVRTAAWSAWKVPLTVEEETDP